MNIIEQFEKQEIERLTKDKVMPDFKAGDTVSISVKIKDGTVERIQIYEGVVIARRNRGITSSFIVRKISNGEGVERRFMLYSPVVHAIKVVKRGVVRRAKLYYLRERSGKAARIKEDIRYYQGAKSKTVAKQAASA